MGINKLANCGSLRGLLSDNRAVVLKEVSGKEFIKVFLQLDHLIGSQKGGKIGVVLIVYLQGQVFDHLLGVSETVAERLQSLEHHKQISEEDGSFVHLVEQDLNDQLFIVFHILDKGEKSSIVDLVNRVKEGCNQVSFNFHILHLSVST